MAEIKAAKADSFVERPDLDFRTFLFHGPDSGLVSERADKLCAGLGIDLTDPFCVIRIDADTTAADTPRLSDEAHTISMFGSSRLIRISGTTRRNLAEAVKPVLEHPPQDSWIVIEAGDLKRDSALRRAVERSESGVAVPCYPDDDAALARLITAELSAAGLTIDDDAKALLRAQLGGDRRASRNELAKLALFCSGKRKVEAGDVREIIGDVSLLAIDDAIDAAITGDLHQLEKLLIRLSASGAAPDMVILSGLRHFQLLQQARYRLDQSRQPPASVANALRPPLHFKRREKFVKALTLWREEPISRALTRLDQAAFEARANPLLAQSLAGTALVALALEAARSRRS